MPQFDTFIFSSSLFVFLLSFFMLLFVNFLRILPRTGSILKLRYKVMKMLENGDSGLTKDLAVNKKRYYLYTILLPDTWFIRRTR